MAQKRESSKRSISKPRKPARKKSDASRPWAPLAVVFDAAAPMSPLARETQRVFRRGVRAQMADLAKKRVRTVVVIDGRVVRGVPRLVRGRYVIANHAGGKAATAKAR